eukprot:6197305-Pleurochrysis_carterae.AAC.1
MGTRAHRSARTRHGQTSHQLNPIRSAEGQAESSTDCGEAEGPNAGRGGHRAAADRGTHDNHTRAKALQGKNNKGRQRMNAVISANKYACSCRESGGTGTRAGQKMRA